MTKPSNNDFKGVMTMNKYIKTLDIVLTFALVICCMTACGGYASEKNDSVTAEYTPADVKYVDGYLSDYPRPQFVRNGWQSLNGEWDFAFDDDNIGEKQKYYVNFPNDRKINVPFTYETKLSGIFDETVHNYIWYNKSFKLSDVDNENKLILHFEGSDYYTKVWVNGSFVGENKGGYSRFSFDITDFLTAGENRITVKVEDSLSLEQPRGKQRYKSESFSCWYVQTTGIWKTVWLETVPNNYFTYVKNTPDYESGTVKLEYEFAAAYNERNENQFTAEAVISFNGKVLNKSDMNLWKGSNQFVQEISICGEDSDYEIKYWSPEEPNLYDIEYNLYRNGELIDTVSSYFGVREISICGDKILLNENELHLKMVLDQGYWKDSHLTPPSDQAIIDDIDLALEYGYNGIRKHQKIEDERFLYWCDVKGVLVWSEMANCYNFNDRAISNFTDEWKKIVRQNYNHPSIITWVPFNESWGFNELAGDKDQQGFINSIYYLTKSMDSTRPVITNDGWEHTISDIITIHDYRQNGDELYAAFTDENLEILNGLIAYSCGKKLFADGYKYSGQPVIMSEYGGISLQPDNGWGYGDKANGEDEFLERFRSVTEAVEKIPYISGYCYTQITDVQQEMNGLLNADRTPKLSDKAVEEIRKINLEAFNKKN